MPREKDEQIHTGELLKAGECEKASQGGLLTTLAGSMRWSWVSRLLTRRTDDFRSMMEAENKLMDVAKDYLRKEDDLRNIGKILSADRSEREERDVVAKLRLANVERAYKERFQDNTISQKRKDQEVKRLDIEEERIESERLEAQIRRQENERRLVELLQKPPREQPKKKTTRGRSEKQKLREKAQKRYESEITRIEGLKATAKAKAVLTKSAAVELEEEMEKIEKMEL